ncbi:phage tail sheath family protein [Pleionea litopenaei]|uniref:Phage tail sheath subtilisin-like domain-containing protein n=1 Tax=Pleionea litopenaei TaxID=3070815 RepID=A0AA51RU86_9GAMM|nr:phage tail sheath subtilisin-like domain-containing protein [Pleionea sp. HL-JVS1]WMS87801.1 phage tail sheath subtilisin-like domain-containing protein [Pleionea sp. HL-JVS1]
MAVNPTYPGVYVQEIPSGVRTIAGVSTSVALMLGRSRQGPLNDPKLCLSYSDYERIFSSDSSLSDLSRQVKLFFQNGGTQCHVMRIANGAIAASVELQTSGGDGTLVLTAKQAGKLGETIRVRVNYKGQLPESTFNLTIFRLETNAAGVQQEVASESFQNLSMDPNSPLFAPDYIDQNSALITASVSGTSPGASAGFSQSAMPIIYDSSDPASFQTACENALGDEVDTNQLKISIDGSRFVDVDFSDIDVSALAGPSIVEFRTQLAAEMLSAIESAFTLANLAGTTCTVSLEDGPTPGANEAPADASVLFRFTSNNDGDLLVRSANQNDLAASLRLGSGQGGLEVTSYSEARPAANGVNLHFTTAATWNALAQLTQDSLTDITLPAVDSDGNAITQTINFDLVTSDSADPMYFGGGVREKLAIIRDAINNHRNANKRTFFWTATLDGYRLSLEHSKAADNYIGTVTTAPTNLVAAIAAAVELNVKQYSVGTTGTSGQQTPGSAGDDGSAPLLSDYEDAFLVADRDIDMFNLMVLPQDAEPAQPITDIYGPASIFCQESRAFLVMDPPSDWTDAESATAGVDDLRVGLVSDHAAVFYPRVKVNENGRVIHVGPSGAIAGLMARIDTSRGVWKAPAGIEASLRGVVGVERQFSDRENGVLNPRAINTIRSFPNGIVNWGSRTMDGDNDFGSEQKYIPVRRLSLYMEESLYRGLKWVVFEPNDEPLWAQIRLNVGSFMHGLFRQGAFQGSTPKEAYFVKCDSETTTQADRNLGIVNIVVGFAPLKPAEFVILSIQQIAGQLEAG